MEKKPLIGNKIPIKYKGEIIAYTDNNIWHGDYGPFRNIIIENQEVWDKISASNPDHVFISSRAKGTIDSKGTILRENTESYDITSLDADDSFNKAKSDRTWNRSFEKDSLVILDEEWMDENEKKQYADLLGMVGVVLESNCDLHCIYGSASIHIIQWPGGKITGKFDGTYNQENYTPNGMGPQVEILEKFSVKFLKDLEKAFPNNKIEFGRGDRIFVGDKILKGILSTPVRRSFPYRLLLQATIDEIKIQFKI